ncbi:MAG: MarC family protein [Candidatus Woesearchaeota archaeon]
MRIDYIGMISHIVAFLAMMNPFAMFLYLGPVMEELENKDFLKVLFKASMISLLVFVVFVFTGDWLFTKVLRIEFNSFRIFGGVIIFSLAYLFIVKGQKALIIMHGDLDNLAEEIALPYMVGAGTISLVVLMTKDLGTNIALLSILIILIANFMIIAGLKKFRDVLSKKKLKIAFDKNMAILLRLNGFFLGAIGVNMVIQGLRELFNFI